MIKMDVLGTRYEFTNRSELPYNINCQGLMMSDLIFPASTKRRFPWAPLIGLILFGLSSVAPATNRLAGQTSPYLLLHAQDPVHWQPWDREAMAIAQRQDKLLFLSIGYFSCHWCHVIQRESYQDASIANKLNRHFVPVKIDRELQPALDNYLLKFVRQTRGQAGWPLHVFLTPSGDPLFGMTYLPKARFSKLLDQVAQGWSKDRAALKSAAVEHSRLMQQTPPSANGAPLPDSTDELHRLVRSRLLAAADTEYGGFGAGAKFPPIPQLRLMLYSQAKRPDPKLELFLRTTLRQMAHLGLRDQLGGGFFRYTTDRYWRTPHFEKMLYTNALLARLYLDAAEILKDPEFAKVGEDTLDFLLADMSTSEGNFIASLSAVDSQNREGAYYLWDKQQLQQMLSPEEQLLLEWLWDSRGPAPFAEGYLPLQNHALSAATAALGLSPEQAISQLKSAKTRLLTARRLRSLPRDNKVISGWNGLALAALATALKAPNGAIYQQAGEALRRQLLKHITQEGELFRARNKAGKPYGVASLADYAYVTHGLLAWAKVQNSIRDALVVKAILEKAWQHFYVDGHWQRGEDLLINLGPGEAVLADGASPSPSAILIDSTLKLARLIPMPILRTQALQAMDKGTGALSTAPFSYASHLLLRLEWKTSGKTKH